MSTKQSLKCQRIRSYFINAAKETILREGVENVTVRRIADLAGYSYATIYNYFSDLNALLLEVKGSMILDVAAYMDGAGSGPNGDINRLKQQNRLYTAYFLERPHVFRFFYSYRLAGEAAADPPIDYTARWHETYRGFVANGIIKPKDVETVAKTIIYALHGMLALYFSGNGLTRESLFDDLDQVTDFLLKGDANP